MKIPRLMTLTGVACLALAAVPAFAHDGQWHGPARGFHPGYARPYYYAPRVVVVRPPVFAPRRVVVYSTAPVYYASAAVYSPGLAYPVGGAIAGAVVGSAIGNGRPAAIAAGAVVGAVIGSQIAYPY